MEIQPQTPSAQSALVAPVTPAAPPVPNSLTEFRAQRAAPLTPVEPTEPSAPPSATPPVQVDTQLTDTTDDTDIETPPTPETPKGPEAATHRWKDPDTGMTLDLRRRDHRRMKRLLEERADLARQVSALRQPPAQPRHNLEPPTGSQPRARHDLDDPEPQLEQFADAPDPYAAHTRALARWEARQEFRQQQASHTRVERARQVSAAADRAQSEYDAGLPQARERYADFDDAHGEVLAELGRLPMRQRTPIVHRLLTSPLRHDLTHYLGSHPDDLATVVSARSAYEQGMVLGAIETRVRALVNQRDKSPAPPITPAPAPMPPVGGSASPVALPDAKTMNLAQFRANKSKFGMTA